MLFDLNEDPTEQHNLASSNVGVVRKMIQRMSELADPDTGYRDPQPQEKDPKSNPKLHDGCLAPWLD